MRFFEGVVNKERGIRVKFKRHTVTSAVFGLSGFVIDGENLLGDISLSCSVFWLLAFSNVSTMSETQAPTTSTETSGVVENIDKREDFAEPDAKKRKISKPADDKTYKLEDRLGGILCCAVCLDLPRAAVYQVSFKFFS